MTVAAVQVLLADDDRGALQLVIQRRSTPPRVRVRAHAIPLLRERTAISVLAEALKLTDDSVSRWMHQRAGALFDAPGTAAP